MVTDLMRHLPVFCHEYYIYLIAKIGGLLYKILQIHYCGIELSSSVIFTDTFHRETLCYNISVADE
jgi:hypothetical protein